MNMGLRAGDERRGVEVGWTRHKYGAKNRYGEGVEEWEKLRKWRDIEKVSLTME